jgi:uncharacterized repeat protein (TIGR02059 family)
MSHRLTRILGVAALVVGLSPLAAPSPAAAYTNTCGSGYSQLCEVTLSQTSPIVLSRGVPMTPLVATTNVDAPADRSTLYKFVTDLNSGYQKWAEFSAFGGTPSWRAWSDSSSTTSGLPAGLSLALSGPSPWAMTISGTPTQTGTFLYEVFVSDAPSSQPGYQAAQLLFTIQVVADTTAPTLTSAVIPADGDEIVLTFDENVAFANANGWGSFEILVDGVLRTVDVNGTLRGLAGSTTVSGSTITFGLRAPIEAGAVVTLDYTVPGTDPIEDLAGNDAAPVSGQAVTNNSTQDLIAPTLSSAAVSADGETIDLTYAEALDATGTIDPTAFAVDVDGETATVGSVGVSGQTVTLALDADSTIEQGATVTLDYTVPVGDSIEDLAGNAAAALTDEPVTNNSTHDLTAPALESAEVDETGTAIVLTFDEDLANTDVQDRSRQGLPQASDFSVTVDGTTVAASQVAIVDDTVTVSLSSVVFVGQVVTLDHTPGTGRELVDAFGNAVGPMSAAPVTNRSTTPIPTPPVSPEDTPTAPSTPAAAETAAETVPDAPSESVLPATGSDGRLLAITILAIALGAFITPLSRRRSH